MQLLEQYCAISGQIISKDKSKVFIGKAAANRRHQIIDSLGIWEGSVPFTYLGVPIFKGKPRVPNA